MSSDNQPPARDASAQTDRRHSAKRHGYAISRVDGSSIYYEVTEPTAPEAEQLASGPRPTTVVLSDGIGCDGFVWKYLHDDLAATYRVIRWHYRGHGRSPNPRDRARVRIPDLADDLACVLDECEVERAVLGGHSMGVQVALEAYRRHRERVSALLLLCGAPGHPLKTFHDSNRLEDVVPRLRALVGRAPRLFNRLSRAVLPTRVSYTIAGLFEVNADLLDQSDFMPYLRGISRVDLELFLDMLSAANEHTSSDLLPEIAVPALIVAGDHDGFTPPWLSVQMNRAIPGSELLMVENGTHTAPIERPEQIDRCVLEFLARRLRDTTGDRR